MITIKEAEAIAKQYLIDLQEEIGSPVQITKIKEASFGWVFFYQSKDYIETGNISSMLAGNAPFIVDQQTGSIHILGTAHPADFYIKEYAQLHGKSVVVTSGGCRKKQNRKKVNEIHG